jgi:VanZ family protein
MRHPSPVYLISNVVAEEGVYRMKRYWQWGSVLVCMAVIFYFSSQPYHKQDMRPSLNKIIPDSFVEEYFGDVVIPYGKDRVSVQNNGPEGFVEFVIRKGAHVTIYAILGWLMSCALAPIRSIRRYHVFAVILFCCLYAISDEIHQFYTGDRTPLVKDVVLDTAGACLGLAIHWLPLRRRELRSAY